ncbi:extracellular solute-binding protein [Microbacterium sp. zg.Y1090]|uniref:ABC transporter substrate-binding protein n=1 Tax=Microbacterium wangruii TaxID=3049073 RepID=UPI00214D2C92|nr:MULTISPECIES: extracellular solute-binding protein [unclassified Microbacterium]MCR2818807.1 extracellular solute-binding protein [Microbacterium sp. zg.Y1090]WIM27121.1 extracellular solute-binding protein [Microbacterium sp. zg-Y1090]
MTHTFRPRTAAPLAAVAALALLVGCSGGQDQEPAAEQSVTFWTPQTTPERLAAQEAVAAAFTEETGIDVDVVPMAGADQDQALVTGAASGNVPDVILHTSTQAGAWTSQGLLDTGAASAVVETLGTETFNERAIDAVTLEGEISAVPSDGWTHVIAYRADLLDSAGVEVPTSLSELADAATAIKDKLGITGLAFGTQAGTASATEGIQSLFQSAGCELVVDGEIAIDSAECTDAAEEFLTLRNSSVAGDFDVTSARATYMNGDAAMLLFSTHILDELAGLDSATPATCPECAATPTFLADNTEFITVLDEDQPAQYGAMLAYGIPTGANVEAAQRYIEYVMSTGYVDTLGVATEGRIPLRNGTAEDPTAFVSAWGGLGIGPGQEMTSVDLYGEDFTTAIEQGINAVSLWGMGTEDATLAGLVSSQGVLAAQIDQLYTGTPAADVTAAMRAAVEEVQAGL